MLVPFLVGLGMLGSINLYLSRTFTGRTILAVSQDVEAVRLIGANPIRAKEIAFGIAVATAIIAGVLLIIIQPVEPSFYGPSWSPAVSFGLLLLTLIFRPAGIFGR